MSLELEKEENGYFLIYSFQISCESISLAECKSYPSLCRQENLYTVVLDASPHDTEESIGMEWE